MNFTVQCPRCGFPVLLIVGGTMRQLPTGEIILLCPRCEESTSTRTITGRAERSKP